MKEHLFLLLLFPIFALTAQTPNKSLELGLGLNNYQMMHHKTSAGFTSDVLSIEANIRYKHRITKSLYAVGGLGLLNISYSWNYNFTYHDPNDPLIPKKTFLRGAYLTIPVGIEYPWLDKKRWKLSNSIIHQSHFLLKQESQTLFADGNTKETPQNIYSYSFPRYISTIHLNLTAAYSLGKSYFTLKPNLGVGFQKVHKTAASPPLILGMQIGYGRKW